MLTDSVEIVLKSPDLRDADILLSLFSKRDKWIYVIRNTISGIFSWSQQEFLVLEKMESLHELPAFFPEPILEKPQKWVS